MAATDPRQPERDEETYGRPRLAPQPVSSPRRTRWIVLGLIVAAVIAVIVYMLAYNGGGSGGSGGGGVGGYLVLALPMDRLRRFIGRNR
jgi:hypothetical protein